MKIENSKLIFESKEERELYDELVEFLVVRNKGKRNLKRLLGSIQWFISEGRGDWFAGYVFDMQGVLSCWGIYEGGKDKTRDKLYTDFMQDHCTRFMKDHTAYNDNLVCYALRMAFNKIMDAMLEHGLIVKN